MRACLNGIDFCLRRWFSIWDGPGAKGGVEPIRFAAEDTWRNGCHARERMGIALSLGDNKALW